MNVKELRIGNIVMWEGNHHKISSINSNGFVSITKKNLEPSRFLIQETKPIKLTEEWLIKLGFQLVRESQSYDLGNFYIEVDFSTPITFTYHSGMYSIKLEYIHQLQNLYYSIRREELIIK